MRGEAESLSLVCRRALAPVARLFTNAPTFSLRKSTGYVRTMSTIASVCAAAMEKEDVLGVLCVDAQGLCLHSAGQVPDATAGAVAAMAAHSKTLFGSDAVVTVDSPQGKALLSQCEDATVAIFMQPTAV